MSELELLKRISTTHLEDCLILETPQFSHDIEGEQDIDSKVSEFLLAKNESLHSLLATEIPSTSIKVRVPLSSNAFEQYVNHHLPIPYLPYNTKRLRMRKAFHSKEPIFQVEQYTQEAYDHVLGELVERFPFLVINAIIKSELGQQEVVRNACMDYLNKEYVQPLMEKIPELSVRIELGDIVTFNLDISKLNEVEKASLTSGNFGTYAIKFD